MPVKEMQSPDIVPVLSKGKHRNARKGACFMELASFLAGERWSDHPSCTHPLLAGLARLVNDHTSDAARPGLAQLVPSVIGRTSDDPRLDVRIALLCAQRALPVASEERQRVMAVAALTCEGVLAELEGRPPGDLSAQTRQAFTRTPMAAGWAATFASSTPTLRAFRRHAAPHIVSYAAHGIALACIADADEALRDLLAAAIDLLPAPDEASIDDAAWQAACELTGVR